MGHIGTKGRAAGIPAKMVQFVPHIGHLQGTHYPTVGVRLRIEIDDAQGVRHVAMQVESDDVSVMFRRSLHGHLRRGIKGRVGCHSDHGFLPWGKAFQRGD